MSTNICLISIFFGFQICLCARSRKVFLQLKKKKLNSSHSRCRKMQKDLLHSRNLYSAAENFTTQQKAIPHIRRFYCTVRSLTALQKVLLHSRRFYCIAESFTAQQKSWSCGKNWRKVPSAAKAEDKLTLQRLSLDFGLNVCAQTRSSRMVLWSPFLEVPSLTSFLEKGQTKRCPITSRRVSKVQKT